MESSNTSEITISDRIAYSPAGAAEAVGLSRSTIYQAIQSQSLPTRKFGRRRVILAEDLRNWFLDATEVE